MIINGKITTKIPHCQKKSKKVWMCEKNVVILHPNKKIYGRETCICHYAHI